MFRCTIRSLIRYTAKPQDGGNVDDAAGAIGQKWQDRFTAILGAVQVGIYDRVPKPVIRLQTIGTRDSRAIDQCVHSAVAGEKGGNETRLCNVALDEAGIRGLWQISGYDRDIVAIAAKPGGYGRPDTSGSTSDDGRFH